MFYLYFIATLFSVFIMAAEFFMSFSEDTEASHESSLESHDEGLSLEDHSKNTLSHHSFDISSKDISQYKEISFLKVLLKTLSWLRMVVYFSLGFGVSGLFATFLGESSIATFLWALGLGIAVVMIYKISYKILRQEIDSTVKEDDLWLKTGEVLIPVRQGQLGKVEIKVDHRTVERYCKSFYENEEFKRGDRILIAKVTEECVYIEKRN